LTVFYNGIEVKNVDGLGDSVSNDGPIYIGGDKWKEGIAGAGYDNLQIHNRALTLTEITETAQGNRGTILFNDDLVLAYDFNGGGKDGVIKDLSRYGHDATVYGTPTFMSNSEFSWTV
jgi:hypothetical protein